MSCVLLDFSLRNHHYTIKKALLDNTDDGIRLGSLPVRYFNTNLIPMLVVTGATRTMGLIRLLPNSTVSLLLLETFRMAHNHPQVSEIVKVL